MARSTGPLHSDAARGASGSLTHRVYRGTGTVSRHRSPSRVRLQRQTILSPQSIPNCFSRFNAGIGATLRTIGSAHWLVSLLDLVGGFGTASQPNDSEQPKWFASDPAHCNQPYILPDGTRQTIFTPILSVPFLPPLDIWIVAADCGTPSINRILLTLNTDFVHYVICNVSPSIQWGWFSPNVPLLAYYSDQTVKIWRILITPFSIQLFWNGQPQSPPKAFPSFNINRLRLLGYGGTTAPYNRRLFEICFWRRILDTVEANLLLRYYRDVFNIV